MPWPTLPGLSSGSTSRVATCSASRCAIRPCHRDRFCTSRLGPGYVWGFDVSHDRDRLVFSFASLPDWPPSAATDRVVDEGQNAWRLRQEVPPLHLYEVELERGQAIRRLTNDPYWNDFEPTCLSDGRIVFSSDRCGKAPECGNVTYDFANPNLYICDRDGSNVRRLTDNRDIDRYPHALDDGRIAYTHWEYQERHFMEVHALWTVHPDGTMSDALFKQHLPAPLALRTHAIHTGQCETHLHCHGASLARPTDPWCVSIQIVA